MIDYPFPIRKVLVTGGGGFIGGSLIRMLLKNTNFEIFNIDKLGYASNLDSIQSLLSEKGISHKRYHFIHADLVNLDDIKEAISLSDPDLVFHLAAESHVDKSISNPTNFIQSNIIGTYNLLEAIRYHWSKISSERKSQFRLLHVSTDEVFGSLQSNDLFSECSRYDPRSPYSATKAASDHLVRAWYYTYGIPIIITNASNNFGPWQFPEKLIPLTIFNGISNNPIKIYGDGLNIRDWIFVEDHTRFLLRVILKGRIGETYCIGGEQQKTNNEIVELICELLDEKIKSNAPHIRLKTFIQDRQGHDRKYGIDNKKLINEIGNIEYTDFNLAMNLTVNWYLNNIDWCKSIMK